MGPDDYEDTYEEYEPSPYNGDDLDGAGVEEEFDTADRDEFASDDYDHGDHDYGDLIDGVGFADPGGNSALRAATRDNPRNLTCPGCGADNTLTPADAARGYQCNACADAAERGY